MPEIKVKFDLTVKCAECGDDLEHVSSTGGNFSEVSVGYCKVCSKKLDDESSKVLVDKEALITDLRSENDSLHEYIKGLKEEIKRYEQAECIYLFKDEEGKG